eukprot:3271069-Alexandrium_andersonii.AAC.1
MTGVASLARVVVRYSGPVSKAQGSLGRHSGQKRRRAGDGQVCSEASLGLRHVVDHPGQALL